MEVTTDSAGRRVFINSPYIDQSEWKRNVVLYDPNGYNIGTSLYERTRPSCERWVDHFHQNEMLYGTRPMAIYDRDGRTYRPMYYPTKR